MVLAAYDQLMQLPGFKPSVRAENARLRALKQERRYEELLSAVKRWRADAPRTLYTYHLAIGTYVRTTDVPHTTQTKPASSPDPPPFF